MLYSYALVGYGTAQLQGKTHVLRASFWRVVSRVAWPLASLT